MGEIKDSLSEPHQNIVIESGFFFSHHMGDFWYSLLSLVGCTENYVVEDLMQVIESYLWKEKFLQNEWKIRLFIEQKIQPLTKIDSDSVRGLWEKLWTILLELRGFKEL